LAGDTLLLLSNVPASVRQYIDAKIMRVSEAPMRSQQGAWPVIRLNALPLLSWPTICRRIVCEIGGTQEVRQAIASAQGDLVAARRDVGVIAFGSDAEIKRTFEPYKITDFDVLSIEAARL